MILSYEEARKIRDGLKCMSAKKRGFIERSMLDILGEPVHMTPEDLSIEKSLTDSQRAIYICLITIAADERLKYENGG